MWLLAALELIRTLSLAQPVVLGEEPVTVPLVSRDKALSQRLFDVARSPDQNVVLVLKSVEADERPEASWEVYVEPSGARMDTRDSCLVGVLALFDRGVKAQNHEPAEFLFVLDHAITAAGKKDLQLRFVPTSGVVVEGRPQRAEVRSRVKIGTIRLAIESRQQKTPDRPSS